MTEVKFIDTTIRDGQASLWAMNMRTSHMLPAMPHLDAAGFDQMEFFSPGSRLKKFVRHLKENPWDWVKLGSQAAERTSLRWHGGVVDRRMTGHVPPEVSELLVRKAVDLGIRYTRLGSNWNNFDDVRYDMERCMSLGMTPVVNVMYSVSPRHTDQYFVQKAREAAALDPFRLCFKDVGGLLTPERVRELGPKMRGVTGAIPWEFHGHCNNGLGPLNALAAVEAGFEYLHTAVPPLANGNSQPSIVNVTKNLEERGYKAQIDLEVLGLVTDHFTYVAQREGFPVGAPYEYDERIYRHQVPGGMISNLEYQLKMAGVYDRLQETLEETAKVRADFGYPIMVTPLSQFIGSQAAINVIVGERYKHVSDQVIEYALGWHGGDEAISAMDAAVRDKILTRPRAAEIEATERPQTTLKELRRRLGESISDEDLILRCIVGDDAVKAVAGSAPHDRYASTAQPLVQLVRELTYQNAHRYVSIQNSDLSLTISKRPNPPPTS